MLWLKIGGTDENYVMACLKSVCYFSLKYFNRNKYNDCLIFK